MKSKYDFVVSRLFLAAIFSGNAVMCFAADAEVPDVLKTPSDQLVAMESKAEGVQIYECKTQQNNASGFEWAFKAPEADLFDANGKKIAHHYAGPTWESNDGSKVVGEVKAKYSAPDAKSIPWLTLSAKSNSGTGTFEHIASIQRINTEGGLAPTDGCDQSMVGKVARIPYKAVYRFYVIRK
jgi:hypothetical protein